MKSTKPRGYRTGCHCQGCDNTEVFSTPEKGKGWMCEDVHRSALQTRHSEMGLDAIPA